MSYTISGTTSMVAAPAMTSMYAAAPASMYAAAPASMYAAAPASMYAPASVIQAAPVTYAAAAPSYVAPPVAAATVAAPAAVAAPSFVIPPFAQPAPVSMTAGLVPPEKLAAERDAYDKALDAQLAKQSNAVLEECKIKQAMIKQECKTQIAKYQLEAEEQCKMACFHVDREAQQMVNGLQEAAIQQRTQVEEQAAHRIADYNKKRALEDMAVKSYDLQKQWYEAEAKSTYDYQKVMQAGSRAIAPGYGLEAVAPVPTFQGAVSAVPAPTVGAGILAPAGGATYASYAAAPIQAVANYGAVGTSTIV